jgi:hypothetical protein
VAGLFVLLAGITVGKVGADERCVGLHMRAVRALQIAPYNYDALHNVAC